MKKIFIICFLLFGSIFFTKDVLAGSATLTWNANTESDLSGYKIYYGTSARSGTDPKVCGLCGYSNSISVGNVTTYTFSGLTDGRTYYFSVSALDTSGNESAFSGETTKSILSSLDTTPPAILSFVADSVTSNGAIINWTTNESSDSQIEYGPTTNYGSQTTLNSSLVIYHSQLLSGLSGSTLYHYRVRTKDASGNQAFSADGTFTTGVASAVLSVSLSADPASGTPPLSGVDLTATVSGSATGNTHYTFYCNRSDAGTNISFPYDAKNENIAQSSNVASDLCSYSVAGIYIAKVVVERGSYQAEARVSVLVGTGTDSGSNLPYSSGMIVKTDSSDKIYIIVGNEKRWLAHPDVFMFHHLAPNSQITVSQADLDKYQAGPDVNVPTAYPEGTLIRAIGDFDVYIVRYNQGKAYKRLILNPSVFDNYGHLKWSDIKDVDQSVVNSFITADLVRSVGDPNIYKLYPSGDTGEKKWVKTTEAFNRLSFDWDSIYEINVFDRDSYATGSTLE